MVGCPLTKSFFFSLDAQFAEPLTKIEEQNFVHIAARLSFSISPKDALKETHFKRGGPWTKQTAWSILYFAQLQQTSGWVLAFPTTE